MALFKSKASYSIKTILLRYFTLLIIFTSGVLIFYCVILAKSYSDQIAHNTTVTMEYYSNSLDAEMTKSSKFLQKLCYSDSSFQLLTMKNLTDSDKIVHHYNITEMIKRQTAPYEGIFIFDKDLRVSTFAAGSQFSLDAPQYVYRLKDHLRDYWLDEAQENYNKWIVFQDEQHAIIMKTLKVRDVYACTTIDLKNFDLLNFNDAGSDYVKFGFFNDERILSNHEGAAEAALDLNDLKTPAKNQFFADHYLMTASVKGTDISMFCLFQSNYMGVFTRGLMIIFFFAAILTCVIIIYTFISFNKILLYPLDQINAATKHLEQNDSLTFLTENRSKITEYQNINHALAGLIEQKIVLTNEKQTEAFEKDHARLQYYHLQTSSHFFVNCLKSLYNMLESREYEKMQRMIIAFSNHLRYIFHDNLKLVTLKSELDEVNDYYNIILLDRTSPFILNTSIDETLLDYKVPSLLIQTFLENTVKYNKLSGNLLIFDIRITAAELDGQPVMQIMLSDNGIGYSEEMLERLNSSELDLFAKEHVGISNLKHRIALIYKANYQFAFYNKPAGGACGLITLPLLNGPDHQ